MSLIAKHREFLLQEIRNGKLEVFVCQSSVASRRFHHMLGNLLDQVTPSKLFNFDCMILFFEGDYLDKMVPQFCIQFFPNYLDQEERDSIRPQGPRQFDVFHFCFYLCHFSTVFVILQVRLQTDFICNTR